MRIKKVGCERQYAAYDELKHYHVVSQGWSEFGDLSFLTQEDIEPYLDRITYGETKGYNAFRNIFGGIQSGDIILAFEGNTLKGIAEMPNDFVYFYNEARRNGYANSLFPVNWVDWKDFCPDPQLGYQGGQGVAGIVNCKLNKINQYIEEHWENYKQQHGIEVQPASCNERLEQLKSELPQKLITSKKHYMQELNKDRLSEIIRFLKTNHNMILTGAPGTGKTYLAKEIAKAMGCADDEIGFVQFHPSYDYTDFVEGLRPTKSDKNENVGFRREDGVFKRFCAKALGKGASISHVFIIDEINRGEISKIFGELFFSIDPGYRGEKGKVMTQYQNMVEAGDVFEDGFYVPENVYIIGTMNDIDRSVESMDFAMRRRFAWVEVTAKESFENMIENDAEFADVKDEIKRRMEALNEAIVNEKLGLGKSYQIGAAYFRKVLEYQKEYGAERAFEMLWENHLRGLLYEYLRGSRNAEEQLETLKKAYEQNGYHHDGGQSEEGTDE